MPKAKVAHITFNHQYNDTRIYKKEIFSLKEFFEVYYFTPSISLSATTNEIKTIQLPSKKGIFGWIRQLLKTKACLSKIEDVKIIHFHDPILLLMPFILPLNKYKFIYDKHEYYEGYYLYHIRYPKWLGWIFSKLYHLLEYIAMPKIDVVVQVSDLMPRSRYPKKDIIVPNYPIHTSIKLPPFETRNNDFVFLGSINRYRGLHHIINLLPQLPNETRFHIIGNFTDTQYETQLRAFSGWSKVLYHGFLTHEQAAPILLKSKIGVLTFDDIPNHKYSKPTKYYEYQLYGLHLLTNDFIELNVLHLSKIVQLFENPPKPIKQIPDWDESFSTLLDKYRVLNQSSLKED